MTSRNKARARRPAEMRSPRAAYAAPVSAAVCPDMNVARLRHLASTRRGTARRAHFCVAQTEVMTKLLVTPAPALSLPNVSRRILCLCSGALQGGSLSRTPICPAPVPPIQHCRRFSSRRLFPLRLEKSSEISNSNNPRLEPFASHSKQTTAPHSNGFAHLDSSAQ